jgi:hypothetical protein
MVYQKDSRQDTLIKTKGKFIDESEQTVIASIKMMGANIEHSARNNYRPYLMLYGEISAIAFPNGRYQTFYPPTQTHVRYEFSDDEISQLATKGLFYDGFQCPEIISDNPNIEIPMTAIARRYLLMDNLYVTLDLASADIHKTDTNDCGYVFADYFETQIPSKLETETIEPEEDAIPTFDDDFAAQFAAEFKDAGFDESMDKTSEDFAKEAVQAEHQQSLISAEAQKLLENSPTAKRQRDIAKQKNKGLDKSAQMQYESIETKVSLDKSKPQSEFGDILDEDDEFAAFRRAQKEFSSSKPILPPSFDDMDGLEKNEADVDSTIEKQAEDENLTIDEMEAKLTRERAAKPDIDENIDFGDAFGGKLDAMFPEEETEEQNTTMTKEDVEAALKNDTSIKHNANPQKLVTPDESPAFNDNDFNMV